MIKVLIFLVLDMINVAVQVVRKLEKNKMEKDIALEIKREFDLQFFPTWQ